jgi:hypothetical protein
MDRRLGGIGWIGDFGVRKKRNRSHNARRVSQMNAQVKTESDSTAATVSAFNTEDDEFILNAAASKYRDAGFLQHLFTVDAVLHT